MRTCRAGLPLVQQPRPVAAAPVVESSAAPSGPISQKVRFKELVIFSFENHITKYIQYIKKKNYNLFSECFCLNLGMICLCHLLMTSPHIFDNHRLKN